MNYLSPNFTLQEFTVSESGARAGVSNEPTAAHVENLGKLAQVLEAVRTLLGTPLIITSGYRSREVNKIIGGSATSMHCHGLAADFIAPPHEVAEACRRIRDSSIRFDQLILEHQWIHLGLGIDRERREVLTKRGSGYVPGIV